MSEKLTAVNGFAIDYTDEKIGLRGCYTSMVTRMEADADEYYNHEFKGVK